MHYQDTAETALVYDRLGAHGRWDHHSYHAFSVSHSDRAQVASEWWCRTGAAKTTAMNGGIWVSSCAAMRKAQASGAAVKWLHLAVSAIII